MVIPHAQVYFDIIVLICRDVYRVIAAIVKALCYHQRIPLICFDSFALLCHHYGRSQDHTADSLFHQFVV